MTSLWRPWRLEFLPGVHQSVMLPRGSELGAVSALADGTLVAWIQLVDEASLDELDARLADDHWYWHRYVVVLPADAPLLPELGAWLGDALVDGAVFRVYLVGS